jgi:hypothetical protein
MIVELRSLDHERSVLHDAAPLASVFINVIAHRYGTNLQGYDATLPRD